VFVELEFAVGIEYVTPELLFELYIPPVPSVAATYAPLVPYMYGRLLELKKIVSVVAVCA
jgi:hypothetical protein